MVEIKNHSADFSGDEMWQKAKQYLERQKGEFQNPLCVISIRIATLVEGVNSEAANQTE